LSARTNHPEPSVTRLILATPALLAGMFTVFLSSTDLTVIAAIMPGMIRDLGVNTADIDRYIWIVNSYLIAYVVSIPIFGRLSDHIGRQWSFLASLSIFAVGTVLTAQADSLTAAVIGRSIQGLGGGGLLPVTIALAGDVLPRRMRLVGVGLISGVETLGWVVGPTWGATVVGFIQQSADPWRWVFWINIPFQLLAILAVLKGFPKRTDFRSRTISDLDVPGTTLLATLLIASNLALSSGGDAGMQANRGLRAFGGTPNPLADRVPVLLAIAGVALVSLVIWERRASNPILPVELFRKPFFVAAVIANFLVGSALMVAMVNVPVLVSLVRDQVSVSRDSALLLAPLTVGVAISALASGRVAMRIGVFRMTMTGISATVLGFALLFVLVDQDHIWRMSIGLGVAGAGIGLLLAPLSATALDASSRENRGAATSTALLFRLLGMTIGMSLLTTAGVYRLQQLTGEMEPIVQGANETTAEFLARQQSFVNEVITPTGVQVMQETFLAAGAMALIAVIPLIRMRHDPDDAS
jgi:MFS family permease